MPGATDSPNPSEPGWTPPEIDVTTPSVARVYDVFLGGKDNYEIDRQAAKMMETALPELPLIARINRHVLRRAVRYLVREAGIRQIIDVGSGLPTAGNIHQIAQALDPEVSVVYVDNDPIVLAHGRALLAENHRTTVIQEDARNAEAIFEDPETRRLIDFDQPFAIFLSGVLHSLPPTSDRTEVTAALTARLGSGGHFLVTNFTDNGEPIVEEFNKATIAAGFNIGKFSTTEELRSYFNGLELIPPGVVPAAEWRPDDEPDPEAPTSRIYYMALGRKP